MVAPVDSIEGYSKDKINRRFAVKKIAATVGGVAFVLSGCRGGAASSETTSGPTDVNLDVIDKAIDEDYAVISEKPPVSNGEVMEAEPIIETSLPEEVMLDTETMELIPESEWEEKYGPIEEEVIEMDLTHPSDLYINGRIDPQYLNEIYADKSLFSAQFEMQTADMVASPETHPSEWFKRYEGWLNSGCTPEEVEQYLCLDGTEEEQAVAEAEFISEMQKKYDDDIYLALTGHEKNWAMYGIFCDAHEGVLRHYIRSARRNGNLRTTVKANVLSEDLRKVKMSGKQYLFDARVEFTNDPGDGSVHEEDIWRTPAGKVGLYAETYEDVLETGITTQTSTFDIVAPFKDLARLN